MFVGMLYVLNVIPAVPLSLKQSGIYHDISRSSTGDMLAKRKTIAHMFQALRPKVFHLTDSDTSVYYFSSVGAPAELSAPISHVWEYYDETSHSWVPSTTVSFDASGGREGGYRAYSKKEHVWPGLWRVTVKVGNNRIVGRMTFTIVKGRAEDENIKL
jgi:hypothetical protein